MRSPSSFFASAAALFLAASATADDNVALHRAAERGRMLYDFDQAAWVASDQMTKEVSDPQGFGVKGWIVEPEEGFDRVIFYRLDHNGPAAAYVVDVRHGHAAPGRLFSPAEATPLTSIERRMVQAREIAAQQAFQPCADAPFNTVVIPPMENGPISVYLLTPQVESTSYPFGGHYEIDVDENGTIRSSRSFTKGCLTIKATPPQPTDKFAGAVVTHLLDETPTEIHVYLSLWMRQPIFVGTQHPERVWRVDGEHIELIKSNGPQVGAMPTPSARPLNRFAPS